MCAMQKLNTKWGQCVHLPACLTTESPELIFLNNALKLLLVYVPCIKWTETGDI